ncbi:C_GCAxxG_C_C family probable redox protein [Selenomonas ruminantium]|uniref:C_GCAxxG_C_C family probable redox protein n=1 Tax=Selenomonas ruminantium TaxID=971 RepID=A0A1M6SIS2_SELRU|nr:C-GCAxxG-C-C family protein [Selenomonas ruminantium]SHK44550.1 C_GCAxxG_C_C family probable redox protein [Selenomonas ruminantium]
MENTMTRAEQAVVYKRKCNCAQAVLLAFAEETGKNEEELMALGSGFGSGMGGMEGTCGAFCGAVMALGMLNKSDKPSKMIAKEMMQEFEDMSGGATICGDLKGIKTGKMLCSCDDCVRHGVIVLEKHLDA